MKRDSAMDVDLIVSTSVAIEKVRLSGETEIELASGKAANFLDRGLDLDPHEVTHHPYNGQNFTNQQKAQDFWIAHASVTLTTSPEFGETSVSILTPAPYSLDKFLHLTDTGSCWCFYFVMVSRACEPAGP